MVIDDPRKKEIRILIVDDQDLTRNMVKAILKNFGFQANNLVTAETGRDALDKLRRSNYDLVVCDWNMPEMSGIELLKRVRSEWMLDELPFLMLTAEVYRENVAQAMKEGVTDYIAKPFTAEVLIEKVKKVLKLE